MILAKPRPSSFPQPDSSAVVLDGITWDTYESILRDLERKGQHLYLTYDNGKLGIMAPSAFHERYKKLPARMIEMLSLELDIPVVSVGSVTVKQKRVRKGLEADESYYVQHEPEMRLKFEIDFDRDPPPDLVIEMDYTHHPVEREAVYARLGVPEIWRFDGKRLCGAQLQAGGKYRAIRRSVAFPMLKLADVERFVLLARKVGEDQAIRAFRDWLREQ